jgi:hypothetical protein
MKNLATLKILRGRLTPHAVTYLRKMPALKHLHLDTKWTKEQNKKFESDLPNCRCEFEPSVDLTFWVLAKKKK